MIDGADGMIRGVEVFSGAGGLAKGIEMAGVRHCALVEKNHDACATLRSNFPPVIVHEGDAAAFDLAPFAHIDFVAGGPPCQPFSLGGKARGHEDRRDMFPAAVRYVRELRPAAFLFENVKGLLRGSFKEYFEYILMQLKHPFLTKKSADQDWKSHMAHLVSRAGFGSDGSTHYNVDFHLVNAADYGVPQKRERVFIVGIRSDISRGWEFPSPTHSSDGLLWSKWVTGEYWDRHRVVPDDPAWSAGREIARELKQKYGLCPPEKLPWLTMRDAFAEMPEAGGLDFCREEHQVREGARVYAGHTGSPIDEPSKTIKAGAHGVPGGENMVRLIDGSSRYLTIFEAKRIQTFPDDFRIAGSWTEAMRQLGNAVPPRLARTVAGSLLSQVFPDKVSRADALLSASIA